VVVACLGLTACSKPADPVTVHLSVPTTSARQASAEQASAVWTVATAVGHSVAVHRQPDGPIVLRLANPNPDRAPLVFLVEQQRLSDGCGCCCPCGPAAPAAGFPPTR
jgi:hypothetical protein